MTLRSPTVTAYFDLTATGGEFLTLNHPTKGELDAVSYPIGGDIATDITFAAFDLSIARGRSRELDEFNTGTASVRLRNHDRLFDAEIATFERELTTEDGYNISAENGPLLLADVGTAYVGNIVPGKRVSISVAGVTLFDGNIDDWDNRWLVTREYEASFFAVDALGELARKQLSAFTATAAQAPGARISEVLDRSEIAFTYNRSIDTGVSTLQADEVTDGTNALNYTQLVARSDLGRLFASRTNVLTFRDRHSLLNFTDQLTNVFTLDDSTFGVLDGSYGLAQPNQLPVTAAAFSDDGVGIPFSGIETTFGSESLWNRVSVTRSGGTIQTASDASSQSSYGIRSLDFSGLLLSSDVQAEDFASYLLSRYKEPVARISSLECKVDGLTDDQAIQALTLDINDIVTVQWTPTGDGSVVSQVLVVEGVEHRLSTGQVHELRLSLGAVDEVRYFVLNDSVLGVLNDAALSF